MSLISIFATALIFENIILVKFLGICPFIGTSKKEETATLMGISVVFVMLLGSVISFIVYKYILVPYEAEYLKTIVFIMVIASLVQMVQTIIKRVSLKLSNSLGIFLPLITTNCAVLGVVLLSIESNYTLLQTITYSLGSSLGFFLIIYIYSTLREKIDETILPKAIKGLPIAFITASIMALIFDRFI